MSDILLNNAVTWLLSNATAIGAVLGWVTKPLRDKIALLEERLKAVETRLVDVPGNLGERLRETDLESVRCQEEHGATRRQVEDIIGQLRDLQQDLNRCVSDEEFQAYTSVSGQKMEKVLETLGYIRGRMKNASSSE